MCDFTNLYTSENGFVLRCKNCAFYQVGFGGCMLSLNQADYGHLCDMIDHLSTREPADKEMHTKRIMIPTPYLGVSLLLCQQEIRDFHKLLCAAGNEITAQSLLALFRKPA